MKFNWGTKIAIVYIGFVLFILGMVYLSFGEKFDLVTEDYYAKEIAFQEKIDKKSRLKALPENLKITIDENQLVVAFPHDEKLPISGKIICFRPSDQTKDFEEEIASEAGKHRIPLERFVKGKYLIQVDWKAEGETYYVEKTVIIP